MIAQPTDYMPGAATSSSVGLSVSENVGKEFSVCVISVICHCLPVQYGKLFCRLHHGLTRPRVQQINNTFVKVISFKTTRHHTYDGLALT